MVLKLCSRTLTLERPVLMGILNATPDSFSDAGQYDTLERRVERVRELLDDGADIVDIGGESGITNGQAVTPEEEITRVVPLIERVAQEISSRDSDAVISVDTYKPAVARAAISAGAVLINDVSGLLDPELADVAAETGVGLVLMHTHAQPKQRLQEPDLYPDGVADDVFEFLAQRMRVATERGVNPEQIVLDPGPDFSKTPAQTVAVLRDVTRLCELNRPLLFAISRKDFIGGITQRPPAERLGGTLAALSFGLDSGAQIFRLHDLAAARDFIAVRDVLRGNSEIPDDLRLSEDLRWQR